MQAFEFKNYANPSSISMDTGLIQETPAYNMLESVHYMDYFEIIIFSEGNGSLALDTHIIPLKRGVFLFISPYQKRKWQVDFKKIKGYYLRFEEKFLNEFFADPNFVFRLQYFFNHQIAPYFLTEVRLFSFENDIFAEIKDEFDHFQKDSPHLLRSILYYILIKLNRIFCEYHGLQPDTQVNNIAYQFKGNLEEHIRNKQRVAEYATLLGISRVSLNTAIKQQFGKTAKQMIKDRLLEEIKLSLLYTNLTIAEIADELSFSEPNNMIRFFKSQANISPYLYRKQRGTHLNLSK